MQEATTVSSRTDPPASPLARRLREVGFMVSDDCVRPTPDRIGYVHLHFSRPCDSTYCPECERPLCDLSEIVVGEDGNGDEVVDTNELCLVCAYCGLIYDNEHRIEGLGVLCHLTIEGENLLEVLRIFDGVIPENRVDVAVRAGLIQQRSYLQHRLGQVEASLARLDADAKPPSSGPSGAADN